MSPSDLSALIGSRICHDLISPLGAIANGVELLQLSGAADSPEMGLIAESVHNANLRIRLFRVAFGTATPGQMLAESEIRTLLIPGVDGRKIEIDWQPGGDQPRAAVKAAFLVLMCFESAMPWGGHVRISREGDNWRITGEAERLKPLDELWAQITAPAPDAPPGAAQVHFALIAPELARQGRTATLTMTEVGVVVSF